MKKRMLTMLLALVMILSALPFSAMAAETPCAHSPYGYYLETVESTCQIQGAVHFFCKNCGKNCQTQVKPLADHIYGKDSKCKVCGIACEHSFGSAVTVAATCTAAGGKTQTCTKCGYIKVLKTTKPTGHKFTIEVTGVGATCTVDGYTTYKVCSACGEKDDSYAVIKATGHKLKTDKDIAATCTKSGTLEQHCEYCEYTHAETRKKLGHNYVPATGIDPTCTEEGFEDYEQCTRCGKQKNITTIAPTGHTYVNGQCENCGIAAPDYTGPSKPNSKCKHTSKSTYTTSPDCEDVGYIVVTCDECHAEMSREIIPAMGHMSKVVIKDATCTEDGFEREICGLCGETISNTFFAKLGHNYENGICTRCGGSDSSKYTNDFQEVQIVGGTAY